jgi:hypothetical protein
LDLLTRGFFGMFALGFGASGKTCTNCPNRGGTAAALTIGPAATSLFRRESTCRFSPSSARAEQLEIAPLGEDDFIYGLCLIDSKHSRPSA